MYQNTILPGGTLTLHHTILSFNNQEKKGFSSKNDVGKGENNDDKNCFPQCFLPFPIQISLLYNHKISVTYSISTYLEFCCGQGMIHNRTNLHPLHLFLELSRCIQKPFYGGVFVWPGLALPGRGCYVTFDSLEHRLQHPFPSVARTGHLNVRQWHFLYTPKFPKQSTTVEQLCVEGKR